VGDDDRAGADLDRFQRRALGRVAHVDHQADTIHFCDDFAPHTRDARVLGLVTAGGEQRLVVVGQLHETRAQRMQNFDQPDIVLDRRRILEAIEDRGAVGVARETHVVTGKTLEYKVREPLEAAVPLLHVGHGFAEIFMIGDGHVHRVDAAGTHLLKDFLRPVAVLQGIYAVGGIAHAGSPLAI
jgi:hypothetical protein